MRSAPRWEARRSTSLPPVALRELPSTQASVLQGIEDAFRGQLRLGEQERNKALFDVSQQVFQNLNKIEQKNISAGKKYQQAFARKKMWSLKRASTAASITSGKGKISGNDPVTVVIKEMLTDGTVINDMEAKDQALTQKLDAYPRCFANR